jgi:nicotinamidase-related amidase
MKAAGTWRSMSFKNIWGNRPMLNLSDCVLLPVDMQVAFDDPSWPTRWNEKVDQNGLSLLEAWRRSNRPIIHVRHDSVQPGSTLQPDHPGNAFRPGFGPEGAEPVVRKSVNSAFIGTDLDLQLRRLGAKSVLVFGITTDMCVSTTVRVGANLGWNMLLAEDACDCCTLKGAGGELIPARTVHSVHVATLGAEFCKVLTTRQILDVATL